MDKDIVPQSIFDQLNAPKDIEPFSFTELGNILFIEPFLDPISRSFIVLILYVFICVLIPRIPFGNILSKNATLTLPAIGILGTFVGVLVAVYKFDPDTIWESLQIIIQGLKIAFSTSIYGLALSIIVRFMSSARSDDIIRIGPEEILKSIEKGHKEANEHSKSIINAIIGDTEGSLNTQIGYMRQDLNEFAKTVADANSTAIIDALEKAIDNFNQHLIDGLGENFARLNDAVGKLLDWQENNKRDMVELRETLDKAVKSITGTSESLQKIEEASKKIPENVAGLSVMLGAMKVQIEKLESHLQSFADISEQATGAVPRIEKILNDYTKGLQNSIESIMVQITQQVEIQNVGFIALQTTYADTSEKINELSEQVTNASIEISKGITLKTQEVLSQISTASKASIDDAKSLLESQKIATDEIINTAVTTITELTDNTANTIIQTVEHTSQQLAKDTSTSLIAIREASENAVTEAKQIIIEHKAATENISEILKEQVTVISKGMTEIITSASQRFVDNFEQSLNEAGKRQEKSLTEFDDHMKAEVSNSVNRLHDLSENHFAAIRESMTVLLDHELQEFANRLGGMAKRLADDYGPLTDQFRLIVKLADEAQKKD